MSPLSRRDFVFLSSGAAIGNTVVPGLAAATHDASGLDFSRSGLVTGKPKPLKHTSIPGFLSAEQIAPHHTAHYGGALRGYSAADSSASAKETAGWAMLVKHPVNENSTTSSATNTRWALCGWRSPWSSSTLTSMPFTSITRTAKRSTSRNSSSTSTGRRPTDDLQHTSE